jgi:CRISPR-associated protein Csm4
MQNFKLILKLKSSIVSDFQSDTIFGHICWAIKYLEGDNVLKEFLKIYQTQPALILSSGFPRFKTNNQIIEFLPKPILRPLTLDEEEKLFKNFYNETKREKMLFSFALKNLKKQKYISISAFEKVKDNLSYGKLYELVFKNDLCPQNFIPKPNECEKTYRECPILNYEIDIKNCPKRLLISKTEEIYHNTKNRLTDRVKKVGGLFSIENIFYNENTEIVIYMKNNYFGKDALFKIFSFISKSGYGADKSIGKGRFEFEIEENFKLPESQTPNAFLTLSNYFPTNNDPTDGYYETIVKFGKLGGDWAKSKDKNWPKDKKTYFKMPIIFIAPGGVFKTDRIKEYYGSLIPKVHIDERIVQYGYTIPLGVRIL